MAYRHFMSFIYMTEEDKDEIFQARGFRAGYGDTLRRLMMARESLKLYVNVVRSAFGVRVISFWIRCGHCNQRYKVIGRVTELNNQLSAFRVYSQIAQKCNCGKKLILYSI